MISVRHVSVKRGPRLVVQDASLEVIPGTCVALVGPNGCGKSTLVAAICGDLAYAQGAITIDGHDVATSKAMQLAQLRAVMTQNTHVAFGFTVAEVVSMGRSPWRSTDDAMSDEAVVTRALTQVDLLHLAQRPVQALSGGELARVAMARVLTQETNVMILDEPTAALDLKHQVQLLRCVKNRTRSGAAALVVLHDLTLAADFADEIVVMSDGHIVAQGTPDAVINAPLLTEVYGVKVLTVPHPITGRPIVVPTA